MNQFLLKILKKPNKTTQHLLRSKKENVFAFSIAVVVLLGSECWRLASSLPRCYFQPSKDGRAGNNSHPCWWRYLSRNKVNRTSADMAEVGVRPTWTQRGCPVLVSFGLRCLLER